MHNALLFVEVIQNISYCADPTSTGSASLLAFACCCKSLEGPIMDVLWRRQVDLCTILKSLPVDSWTINGRIFVREKPRSPFVTLFLPTPQSLSRNLSRDEWRRFKKYTARVITLEISKTNYVYQILRSRPQAWVSMETIQLLGMESQRGGFWPWLCSLKYNTDWEIPFLSLFLTPTITELDLTLPRGSNQLLQPTLSLLADKCRQLQSLTMDVDASSPLSGDEMGRLIAASKRTLRCIRIRSPTPPDIFPEIFNLPQLQDLTLQEPHLPNQTSNASPRLQAITFYGNHGPNLPRFLRRLTVPRLTKVMISRGGIIQFSAFLEALRGARATMSTLYLSPVITIDHSNVTLLRSFINLTSLSVGCVCEDPQLSEPCGFQLTDEGVLKLGKALPHIRLLSLGPNCRAPRHVTFRSLIYLSRTCGNLENLSIRVDFTSIAHGSDQLNRSNPSLGVNGVHPRRTTSKLGTLGVGNSPLPDTPRCEWVIALALVRIFPSIRFISSYCTEDMHKRWEEVEGDILVCNKIFHITQAIGKRLSVHVWQFGYRWIRFRHPTSSVKSRKNHIGRRPRWLLAFDWHDGWMDCRL